MAWFTIETRRLPDPSYPLFLLFVFGILLVFRIVYAECCTNWKSKLTLFPLFMTIYIHLVIGSLEPRMIEITHFLIALIVLSAHIPHSKWVILKFLACALQMWLIVRANHCDFYGRGIQVTFTDTTHFKVYGVSLGTHPITLGNWKLEATYKNVTIIDRHDGCECNATEPVILQGNKAFALLSSKGCSISRKLDIAQRYNFTGVIFAFSHHSPIHRIKHSLPIFAIDDLRYTTLQSKSQKWSISIKNDFTIECFLSMGLLLTYILIK